VPFLREGAAGVEVNEPGGRGGRGDGGGEEIASLHAESLNLLARGLVYTP
jgi:hypothetical protein